MRRTAIIAGLVGLVALAAWLRSEARVREEAEGGSPAAGGAAQLADEVVGASAPRAGDGESSWTTRTPLQEPAAAADAHGGASSDGLRVRVVDAAGAPSPGAEVFLVDHGIPRAPREKRAFEPVDRMLEERGERRLADGQGWTRFAPPRAAASVAARTADGFALRDLLAAEPGPVELVLAPDPVVRVRVRAGSGEPVEGVPVGLGSADGDVVRALTDDAGVARLRARGRGEWLRPASVALALPLADPVVHPLDLEHVPAEPIELVLPPTGALDVVLVDERGAPWTPRTRVFVERVRPEEPLRAFRFAELWTENGVGRLEHVGLGIELRVVAEPEERDEVRAIVRGPERAGKSVEARIVVGAALPVIVGRAVDEVRRPLAHAQLEVRLHHGYGWSGRTTTTGADGGFRCELGGEEEHTLGATLELTARRATGETFHAELPSPRLQPGVHDLGELVLAPAPLVARGTVREPDGTPVPRAVVRLVPDADPGLPWGGQSLSPELRTDALGRFEHRAVLDARTLGIDAEAEDFAFAPRVHAPVGADGIELVLERAGSIRVRLAGIGLTDPIPELEREGQRMIRSQWSHSGDVRFYQRLLPGTYSLAFGYSWSAARVRIDGIVVRAGAETRDPRLDPLDLAELLPLVTLTVVDPDGARVPGPSFFVPHAFDGQLQEVRGRADGERWLLPLDVPQRVRVEAPGFRTLDVEVDGDRTLVLARGIPVRLDLAGALPPLPDGWTITGHLARQVFGVEGAATRRRTGEPELALDSGSAALHVAEPGSYSFSFRVRPAGRHAGHRSFWNDPQSVLEVRDDGTEQLFVLAVPDATTRAEIAAFVAEER
jgi:hypothetical protein